MHLLPLDIFINIIIYLSNLTSAQDNFYKHWILSFSFLDIFFLLGRWEGFSSAISDICDSGLFKVLLTHHCTASPSAHHYPWTFTALSLDCEPSGNREALWHSSLYLQHPKKCLAWRNNVNLLNLEMEKKKCRVGGKLGWNTHENFFLHKYIQESVNSKYL